MKRASFILFSVVLFSVTTYAQSKEPFEKECRISAGFGAAGPVERDPLVGIGGWVQMDYRLLENVSVAMDFENSTYKFTLLDGLQLQDPFETKYYVNNFSLLLKYHLLPKSTFKLSIASGWTYSIWQVQYTYYERTGTSRHLRIDVTTSGNYRIPVIVEAGYPLSKKINVTARMTYSATYETTGTYLAGLGLSLKL